MMMTFAISLLFAAGAAFALLVIVGMLAGNWQAICSAARGEGAFGLMQQGGGSLPPRMTATVRVGPVRRGLGQERQIRTAGIRTLRAAA